MASHTFNPSQYTQIWKSQPIPNDPISVSGTLSPAARTAITHALLNLNASAFTSGKTSISDELDFTPPASGHVMIPVTQATYAQLFSLAKALNLSSSNL